MYKASTVIHAQQIVEWGAVPVGLCCIGICVAVQATIGVDVVSLGVVLCHGLALINASYWQCKDLGSQRDLKLSVKNWRAYWKWAVLGATFAASATLLIFSMCGYLSTSLAPQAITVMVSTVVVNVRFGTKSTQKPSGRELEDPGSRGGRMNQSWVHLGESES